MDSNWQKKNKKKKSKPKPASEASGSAPESSKSAPAEEGQPASSEKGSINGYHVNGAINDTESVDSLSEGLETLSIDARELEDPEFATADALDRAGSVLENGVSDFEPKSLTTHSISNVQQSRNAAKSLSRATTGAQVSNLGMENVPLSSTNKKLGSNIEKSVKDLQRCTVSLARYRVVVKEEMDASIKKMKQAFAELQSCLMDREVALLAEMDKVKAEAMEILLSRQKKAELLKKMTDVAVRMSEEQLVELRADIKHFVSERKYDEDLGRVARFTCDVETLKQSIDSFGQVSHPKNSYSTRSRCSSLLPVSCSGSTRSRCSSLLPVSCSGPSDVSAASSAPDASAPSLPGANKRNSAPREASAAMTNSSDRPCQAHREVFSGNRRGGQGYRPQNQKTTDPQTKGGMTMRVATGTARGTHLGPGIRLFRLKPQEALASGAALTLRGPMELEPARSQAHPSLHSKRGSHSANQGPPRLKLRTLEGIPVASLLSHPVQPNNWTLGNVYLDLITKRNLCISLWAILNIFDFYSHFLNESCFPLAFPSDNGLTLVGRFHQEAGQLLPASQRRAAFFPVHPPSTACHGGSQEEQWSVGSRCHTCLPGSH